MDAAAHLRSVACVASTLYADAQHSHNAIIFGLFQFHLFKEITRVGAYAGSEIHFHTRVITFVLYTNSMAKWIPNEALTTRFTFSQHIFFFYSFHCWIPFCSRIYLYLTPLQWSGSPGLLRTTFHVGNRNYVRFVPHMKSCLCLEYLSANACIACTMHIVYVTHAWKCVQISIA